MKRATLPLLVAVLCLAGCGGEDPELIQQRSKYLLPEEPTGAVGIVDAKQQLADSEGEIVLTAKVGAGEHETWEDGKAVFAVSEIVEDEPGHGGDGHDPSTCPFCKRRQSLIDTRAIVQVVDDQGEVVGLDARKLLKLSLNQHVVVRGRGKIDSLGNLVLSADGVYVK